MLDVVVIGGGPAGSTAGRLLAQWGHAVAILAAPPGNRPGLAECLPPSNHKLFHFLGIAGAVEHAGFFPTTGNTVWWETAERRLEFYPDGFGYQVVRREFDRLLLDLARAAGVTISTGKAFAIPRKEGPRVEFQPAGRQPRIPVPARFILDCSGRAGVLARMFHVKHDNSRTAALCGIWRNELPWDLPDQSHTLVEAYPGGWAWSVPVSPSVRHVAFMIDPGDRKIAPRKDIGAAYHAEMAKTRAFRGIFRRGTLEAAPWGRDATVYSRTQYCGPAFVLAGDAGATIDPLSSFGVKKAMVSAWVGAVVANTWLRKPALRQAALQFFEDREREVYANYRDQSAAWYRGPAIPPDDQDLEGTRLALEDLKARPSIHLHRAPGVRLEQRPGIDGNEIVLRDVLVVPGQPHTLDFVESVDLPRLLELAECHTLVPDIFDSYNRVCRPVPLPSFLKALSTLLAKRILV